MHRVVLTFDDGPHPENTPRILDLLREANVQAVFFVLGERLQAPGARDIVRRAFEEGHSIGNHSFSHPRLTELSPGDIRSQILQTHELISEFEPKQKLFRPPHGATNETVQTVAKELKYKTVLWNVNSEDWKQERQPSAWVDVAVEQIRERYLAICLCHDDRDHTAAHLSELLEKVKRLPKSRFVSYARRRNLGTIIRRVWEQTAGSASNRLKEWNARNS